MGRLEGATDAGLAAGVGVHGPWGGATHLAMVSTPSFTRSRSLLNVCIFMMDAATGSVEKCWGGPGGQVGSLETLPSGERQ